MNLNWKDILVARMSVFLMNLVSIASETKHFLIQSRNVQLKSEKNENYISLI